MEKTSEEQRTLEKELNACMFGHYKYFAAGILLGLPISIQRKSYWPFTFAAVAGSAADIMEAQTTCKPQKEALDRCIASQKLEEKRRREAEGNVLLEEDALPKSSRGERVSNSADTSTR